MFIEGSVQGRSALLRYLLDRPAPTPPDVHAQLTVLAMADHTPSPVVACVEAAELIYARREDLDPALLTLGADLAEMVARNDFHGLGVSGRGLGMEKVMRAADGVAAKAKAPRGEAPEAKAEYVASPGSSPDPLAAT